MLELPARTDQPLLVWRDTRFPPHVHVDLTNGTKPGDFRATCAALPRSGVNSYALTRTCTIPARPQQTSCDPNNAPEAAMLDPQRGPATNANHNGAAITNSGHNGAAAVSPAKCCVNCKIIGP